jgi:hypothetical protein
MPKSTSKQITDADLELLADLGEDTSPELSGQRSAKEEESGQNFV